LIGRTGCCKGVLRNAILAFWLWAGCGASQSTEAQGTAADYARAAAMPGRVNDILRGDAMELEWIDAHRLWYSVEPVRGRREYMLVDAERGTRQPLLDVHTFARALSTHLGRAVDPAQLVIERILVDAPPVEVEPAINAADAARRDGPTAPVSLVALVRGIDHPIRFDARAGVVTAATPDDQARLRLQLEPARRRSRQRAGSRVDRVFVNRSGSTVRLVWIDAEGREHRYATVADGAIEQLEDHKDEDHKDEDDKDSASATLGYVLARERADIVVIEPPLDAPAVAPAPAAAARSDDPPDPAHTPAAASPATAHPVVSFHDHNISIHAADGTGELLFSTTDGRADDAYVPPVLWSPDGTKLVVSRRTPRDERTVHIVESSPPDQVQPKLRSFPHAKPGDRIETRQPYLVDIARRTLIELPDRSDLFGTPWHGQRELAELGFVVVQIDGMGTSQRSKAFHDVCWKNLKDAGLPDRVAWLRAAAATHADMDLERVGIYGGSAGGQNAVRAMLDHGDVYRACVADCGCHDNRMDKMWWNELWMGWPVDDSYAANSNAVDASRLSGALLLIVGELDSNVDPASTMQVVDALVRADKDFDLLVMPGVGHGAAESAYGRRRRADFFVRHLMDVEPRRAALTPAAHESP